jgi:hypothetical protein
VPALANHVDDWPLDRPTRVNEAIDEPALEAVRHSLVRGTPLGDTMW